MERILGRRCIRHIGMYISWESACMSVQGLMVGSTEYWDSIFGKYYLSDNNKSGIGSGCMQISC